MSNEPRKLDGIDIELVSARVALTRTRQALLNAELRLAKVNANDFAPVVDALDTMQRRFPGPTRLIVRTVKAFVWLATGNFGRYLRSDRRRREEQALPTPQLPNLSGSEVVVPPSPPGAGGGVALVIDHAICKPDQDAGSRCTISVIRAMRDMGWAVWFWNHDRLHGGRYTVALEAMGVGVADARWQGSLDDWLAVHGATLNHVMVLRPGVARAVLPAIFRHTSCRISYHGIDLHYARLRMLAEQFDDPLIAHSAEQYLELERALWRVVDEVVYLSDDEVDQVLALEPDAPARAITPYAFDRFHCRDTPPAQPTLLFVGGFRHTPNEDGLLWFVAQILPLVVKAVPTVVLRVIGSHAPPAVLALAGPNVAVLGAVDDEALAQAYETTRVVIAPLRVGAGVKGKVVEALALGVPVVTTSVGAQGISDLAAIVPVTDDAGEFASAVMLLLEDDDLWRRQSLAQAAYAEQHFSRESVRRSVAKLL